MSSVFKTSFLCQIRGEIEHYLLFLSVPAIITFIMAALYFPSKPPTPPSNSAKVNPNTFSFHTHFCPGGASSIPSWGNSTSEKPKLLGNCSGLGNPSGSVSTGNLGSRTYPGPLQAVWNNWCALMVISLTKISLEGSSPYLYIHYFHHDHLFGFVEVILIVK